MDKFCSACKKKTDHYLKDPVLMRYVCCSCSIQFKEVPAEETENKKLKSALNSILEIAKRALGG